MHVWRRRMTDILFLLLSTVMFPFIRKCPTRVLLSSNGGTALTGNARAMFDYLLRNETPLEPYVLVRSHAEAARLRASYPGFTDRILVRSEVRHIKTWLSAKWVLVTHGAADLPPAVTWGQRVVQLWHGVPFKRTGVLEEMAGHGLVGWIRRSWKRYIWHRADYVIVDSELAGWLRVAAGGFNATKIRVFGQARNDLLLEKESTAQQEVRARFGIPGDARVILYAPTWQDVDVPRFFPFPDLSITNLEAFCRRWNAVFLLKQHIKDGGSISQELRQCPCIYEMARDEDVQLALRIADILVTDYSSVWLDFLLLDHPIVFVPYPGSASPPRGLMLDYDLVTPGPKVSTFESLCQVLERHLLGDDPYRNERQYLRRLIHKYVDGQNRQRLAQFMAKGGD